MMLREVLGQEAALRTLQNAVRFDRLPSAYLFEGPPGVGKQTAALALATEVVAGREEDPEQPRSRRIASGSHPDVRIFRPRDEGAGNIQVEVLRRDILPIAQYAPFEAGAAFLIFPDADTSFPDAHPESANALLKTLEEPRVHVHFVLISARPERLLPTIRSRCQRVRFGHLPRPALEQLLTRREVPAERRATAVALAQGRADRALALAESEAPSEAVEEALRIDRLLSDRRPGELVALSEEIARRPDLSLTLETLTAFYRDVAAWGLGIKPDRVSFHHEPAVVQARSQTLSPAGAAKRAEVMRAAVDTFERNANRQVVLDALWTELAHIA